MILEGLARLESEFFRALNLFAEPLVRAGFGAPLFLPAGAIVVQTKGRKTGRRSNAPLMAVLAGDLVIVSTVRPRSNWLRNLAADPEVRYWLRGREHEATAFAIGPDVAALGDAPARVRCIAAALKQQSVLFGTSFAILMPRDSSTTRSQ